MNQAEIKQGSIDKPDLSKETRVQMLKTALPNNPGKFLYLLLALAFVISIILGWQVWLLGKKKEAILEDEKSISTLPTPVTTQLPEDIRLEKLENVTDSDEIASIEADLNNTDLEKMDKELELIEKEISS